MSTTKTVNGNTVRIRDSAGYGTEQIVRRAVVDVGRDATAVDTVMTLCSNEVRVRVTPGESFTPPDGWTIESVHSGSNGGTIARVRRDD